MIESIEESVVYTFVCFIFSNEETTAGEAAADLEGDAGGLGASVRNSLEII